MSAETDKIDRRVRFADHLLASWPTGNAVSVNVWLTQANSILDNPQAHLDALVEAGALERSKLRYGTVQVESGAVRTFQQQPVYVVVQPEPPHVHDWRVRCHAVKPTRYGLLEDADHLAVQCDGCEKWATVPNRLPLEVPA